MDKIGGVRQVLQTNQPQDYPVGKWFVADYPGKYGLPSYEWAWLVDVEEKNDFVNGWKIKQIKAVTNTGREFHRIIGSDNDSGWKQII